MSIMKIFKKLFRIKKCSTEKKCSREQRCSDCDEWANIGYQEEGREVIKQWRKRRQRIHGARKSYHEFLVYSLTLETLSSFCQNINLMVVIQIVMALASVYIFDKLNVSFNLPVPVLVSPIVFPLAFSINTDFQRREKVLEDLAVFKSSGMIWFFCMREWQEPAGLTTDWITAVHGKLKSLLFHLREYLLTYKLERRKVILRAMYEDFSDANQLIEKVRSSQLPANAAVVSKSIQLLNMMCLSFERLRVIREYRSPRSIRSFNKVFIMFLPIFLAPYFLHLGITSHNEWEPYYISALVAFVFSSLQSVQDKLDDPFGGMSEDDIDLDTIDEWTFSSLEHTMKRTLNIGRFKVTVDPKDVPKEMPPPQFKPRSETFSTFKKNPLRCRSTTLPCSETNQPATSILNKKQDFEKLASLLEGVSGNARINRRSEIEQPICEDDEYGFRKVINVGKTFESIVEEELDGADSENIYDGEENNQSDSSNSNEPKMRKNAYFLELTTVLSDSNGDTLLIRKESINKSLNKLNANGITNASYLQSIFNPDDVDPNAPNDETDDINDEIERQNGPRSTSSASTCSQRSRLSSADSRTYSDKGIHFSVRKVRASLRKNILTSNNNINNNYQESSVKTNRFLVRSNNIEVDEQCENKNEVPPDDVIENGAAIALDHATGVIDAMESGRVESGRVNLNDSINDSIRCRGGKGNIPKSESCNSLGNRDDDIISNHHTTHHYMEMYKD